MDSRILKPCPFCGKMPHFAESSARGEGYHCWYWCDCGIGTDPFKNAPELISYWNRRSSPAEPEPCEYAQDICDKILTGVQVELGIEIFDESWARLSDLCITPAIESYTSRLVQEAIITERNRCISAAIAYADNHGQEIMEDGWTGLADAVMNGIMPTKPDLSPRFETRSGITTDVGE